MFPRYKDVFENIPQGFQILGSLKNKRIVTHSTTNKGITFFATTRSMGFGFIEIVKLDEEGRKRWGLVYVLVCS